MKKLLVIALPFTFLISNSWGKSVTTNVYDISCIKSIDQKPRCNKTYGTHIDPLFAFDYVTGYFCEVNVIYKKNGNEETYFNGRFFESERTKSETLEMLQENNIDALKALPSCK